MSRHKHPGIVALVAIGAISGSSLPAHAEQWQCIVKETYLYRSGSLAPGETPMTSPKKGEMLRFDDFWGTLEIGRSAEKPELVYHLSMWQQATTENNLVAGRVFVGPKSTAVTVLRIDTLVAGVPFFLYHLDDIATGNCKVFR